MGFPLFGNGEKTGGVENPGEKFLSRAHKFFLPNREEKQGEKTASKQIYRNTLPLTLHSRPSPTPPKTFVPNPYHFFSSSFLYLQHIVHCSRFSPLSLSFFFLIFFSFNVIYCFLSSLYSSFSC